MSHAPKTVGFLSLRVYESVTQIVQKSICAYDAHPLLHQLSDLFVRSSAPQWGREGGVEIGNQSCCFSHWANTVINLIYVYKYTHTRVTCCLGANKE